VVWFTEGREPLIAIVLPKAYKPSSKADEGVAYAATRCLATLARRGVAYLPRLICRMRLNRQQRLASPIHTEAFLSILMQR